MPVLPDEILSEILSPALKVSDDLFSDTSVVSPFSTYAPSTSAYLLVCKDWLRVATPLLYHVVVLRSKAQANALETVLRGNSEFGRYIKKLRVEGGYGTAMLSILKVAPNVTDLFISLSIWSSDATSGLCKGLPLINPHRVIVLDHWTPKPLNNKNLAALTETLLSCIRTWTNLKVFTFPYGSSANYGTVWRERARNLVKNLAQAQTVHTIQLSCTFWTIPEFISQLCDIPSLRLIQFEKPLDDDMDDTKINSIPKLKALARYATVQSIGAESPSPDFVPEIAPSLDPSFTPMESASEESREIVWKRVLFFAMYVEELRDPAFPRWPTNSHPSRLPILSVSKYFNRLGLPYLYDCPNLTLGSAPMIAEQLQGHPDLGSSIRFLFMPWDPIPTDSMHIILSHASNVESFVPRGAGEYVRAIPVEVLDVLARTAGPSLKKFHVALEISTISTSLLAHFTALRILELRCPHSIRAKESDPAPDALKSLHTLRIRSRNTSFLDILTSMRLESLRTLILPFYPDNQFIITKFLKAHGRKLLHLTVGSIDDDCNFLDLCPFLVDVEFLEECDMSQLTRETPHQTLTKITADELPDDFEKVGLDIFDMFPALREIKVGDFRWPTTEREINKSKRVPIAESLLEKGIELKDSTGKHWIPRVKSTRARAQRR
ncbi:F-box domain-containing protein [Mycena venus]|uniref:F-box domain-containing protein n=1 Tax=Mycena venus TaxID=2733690 RepID=A0A8H7CP51_9AGAR|nr:F-box domain-containing protein [Mycena venus]